MEDQYNVISQINSPTNTSPSLAGERQLRHQKSSPPTPSAISQIPTIEPQLVPVTSATDAFFLDCYCRVIGPWFDLFDTGRQFSYEVPHLSLSHPLLLLSSLACAAKQHHLTTTKHVDTALAYYDDALRLLTISLKDVTRPSSAMVFASCLLLAHCEMIGASTQDWHLHLKGTFSLVSAHGWHGCSGGLGQACFW